MWSAGKETKLPATQNFVDITTGNHVTAPMFEEKSDYGLILNLNPVYYIGDIDHSNTVDIQDAILALKTLAGMQEGNVRSDADVNGDGRIGTEDVIYILQIVTGMK